MVRQILVEVKSDKRRSFKSNLTFLKEIWTRKFRITIRDIIPRGSKQTLM